MRSRPLIISVIGRQNAGKTTVAAQMVTVWTKMGLTVGVLKHDGHAGMSDEDWEKPGSDTVRMAGAGANLTMVAGGRSTLLRTRNDDSADNLPSLLQRMKIHAETVGQPLDVIIVEGFKSADLAKVLVVAPTDGQWLAHQSLTQVHAVVPSPLSAADKWTEGTGSLLENMLIHDCPSVSFTQKHPTVYHGDNLQDLCESLWLPYDR